MRQQCLGRGRRVCKLRRQRSSRRSSATPITCVARCATSPGGCRATRPICLAESILLVLTGELDAGCATTTAVGRPPWGAGSPQPWSPTRPGLDRLSNARSNRDVRWDGQGIEYRRRCRLGCSVSASSSQVTPQFDGITFHEAPQVSAQQGARGFGLLFRFTVNGYRGCSHACRYCFARPTHQQVPRLRLRRRLRHPGGGEDQRRRRAAPGGAA